MDASAVSNLLQDKLKTLDQARLSNWLSVIIIGYLLWLAAQLTWKLLPAPANQLDNQIAQTSSAKQPVSSSVDIKAIQQLNLFGQWGAKPVEQPKTVVAPVTKLRVTLSGVVATEDPKAGAAIIENRSKQATYGVNDKIEGTQAFLREIYPDRVILEQAGSRETLMLEGRDYSQLPAQSVRKPTVNSPASKRNVKLTEQANKVRSEVINNPGKITDYIRISPVRRSGQLEGYRLMPGKSPELFRESGLKPNDLAKEINGYDLTDPANAMTAMNELRSAESISLTVSRNGDILSLEFALPSGG